MILIILAHFKDTIKMKRTILYALGLGFVLGATTASMYYDPGMRPGFLRPELSQPEVKPDVGAQVHKVAKRAWELEAQAKNREARIDELQKATGIKCGGWFVSSSFAYYGCRSTVEALGKDERVISAIAELRKQGVSTKIYTPRRWGRIFIEGKTLWIPDNREAAEVAEYLKLTKRP